MRHDSYLEEPDYPDYEALELEEDQRLTDDADSVRKGENE